MTDQTALEQEIAAEQRHLDRVYARLAELRRSAARAEREGYRLARVGNFGALVERDAMVFHAAQRRHALDAEHEGLVFGRLDLRDRQVLHVGRLGMRDEDAETLVVDWRAPAAAAFYQATPAEPLGVVRRRTIQSCGEQVTRIEDDLLDPDAAPPEHDGGRRRRAAGHPVPGHRPGHARHRRDDPAGAGRGDPLPRLRRDDRLRRSGHRQDRGGPAPGGVPALLRPQPVRRRRHPGGRPVRGLRRVHRLGAAVAGRGRRHPALARLAVPGHVGRPAPTRRRWRR